MSPPLQPRGPVHLASLISTDLIVPDMASRARWPAITELVDHLEEMGLLHSCGRDELLDALRTREEFVSTGIGSGVAIPHTFSDRIDGVIAVMGRSVDGIDFDSHDDAPVHLVILFVVPRLHYDMHLRTLAAIARLFHNDEMKRQLLAASTAEEMLLTLQGRVSRPVAV